MGNSFEEKVIRTLKDAKGKIIEKEVGIMREGIFLRINDNGEYVDDAGRLHEPPLDSHGNYKSGRYKGWKPKDAEEANSVFWRCLGF